MDPKLLTANGWKTTALKFKIKDNGLQKALAEYEGIDDDEHDDLLEGIASVSQLAATLKKVKEVAANPTVAKYLADLLSATESEKRDIAKDKAAADKAQAMTQKKADSEAKKRDDDGDKDGEDEEEDEEEEGAYEAKLIAAFQKLKGAKGVSYQFIVCDAKPHCGVMVAKRITSKHKEELTKITGGSKRFLKLGTCSFQDGKFTFGMEDAVTGLARKLQDSIKNFTGKKLPIAIGDESADADEGQPAGVEDDPPLRGVNPELRGQPAPEPQTAGGAPSRPAGAPQPARPAGGPFSISAAVGRGGKNKPEDVTAVQGALNSKAKAGLVADGKCGPKTINAIMAFQKTIGQSKPDGRIDPGRGTARALAGSGALPAPPAPPQPVAPPKLGKAELSKAPAIWHSTRDILDTNIDELKKAVRGHYANEHPDLFKEIDEKLGKLDSILDKLDTKLAESLAKAHAAANDAARKAELKNSKTVLADYIKYVKTEPLIKHIDSNPFGVATNLMKVLTDSLTHMAQSIG